MRTIIELPADQVESLDEWCRREGVSRAEAVRRAVADHLQKHHTVGAKRAFGIWRDLAEDGLAYQERLRSEWDDRERGWS
ncbi:MAG: CopG family transcriptional regulator [Acidobacteriota bacterium]|nr:CopG family transcriptional regulator [Acidobacteriota bacterium]